MIAVFLIALIFLVIPFYAYTKWALEKMKIGNEKSRKTTALISTFVFVPLIYGGIIYFLFYYA